MALELRVGRLVVGGVLAVLVGCSGGGGSSSSENDPTADATGNPDSSLDITIVSISAPATANAGESVTASVTVRNSGSEMVSGFGTTVYLSQDTTISSGDDSQGTSYTIILDAGEETTITRTFTMPPNLRTGNYYIGAITDTNNSADESNESNNTASSPITVSGTTCNVDGYEEDDTAASAKPLLLDTQQQHNHCDDYSDWYVLSAMGGTTYSLTTSNLAVNADTSLTVYGGDATTLLAYDANSGMEPNSSRLSWTAPADGNYYLKVGTVTGFENTGSDTGYTVTYGQATSDLGLLDASVNGTTNLWSGATEWVIFTVYNNGFASSGKFIVKAYLTTDKAIDTQDPVVGIYTVADLAAGASQEFFNVDISIPKNTSSGTYYLGFVADADNTVAEFNEGNNEIGFIQLNITAPTCALDEYEDDDFKEWANEATFGVTQHHNFCEDEKDYVSFPAVEGKSYVVKTKSEGAWDPNIKVYDPDGTWVGGAGWDTLGGSEVTYTFVATKTGTYYAAGQTSSNNGGADSGYALTVFQDLPDLVVDYLSVNYQSDLYPGGLLQTYVSTNNNGFEAAGASETAFYLSTDTTIDANDIYLGMRTVPALASFAEDSVNMTLAIPPTVAPGTYYFGAIADASDQVSEIYENNNVFYPTSAAVIKTLACTIDLREQDDLITDAKTVTVGITGEERNFCDDQNDWMKFDATQGSSYVFHNTNIYKDVKFVLYDKDQSTVLVSDADDFVHFVAPDTGTYYVLTKLYTGYVGDGENYILDVYTCDKDVYEDDDSIETANVIAVGETQSRNLCDDAADYAKFTAVPGTTYTISVPNGYEIQLTNGSSPALLAWATNVTWTAPQPGTDGASSDGVYYIRASADFSKKGKDTNYTLILGQK